MIYVKLYFDLRKVIFLFRNKHRRLSQRYEKIYQKKKNERKSRKRKVAIPKQRPKKEESKEESKEDNKKISASIDDTNRLSILDDEFVQSRMSNKNRNWNAEHEANRLKAG